jgi:uncharacterized phage-associated protein
MSHKAVDAKGLANLFLEWADAARIPISPLKLQKLVFFAHADFLVRSGRPLVRQEFEAWDYGPVIPSLYSEFKRFRDRQITSRAMAFDPVSANSSVAECSLEPEDLLLVRSMFEYYCKLDAIHLSQLSHEFEGAWRQARALFSNGLNMDRRISNVMIVTYHRPIHS